MPELRLLVVGAVTVIDLGTAAEPVELGRYPEPGLLVRLRHAHVGGVCIKNRWGHCPVREDDDE